MSRSGYSDGLDNWDLIRWRGAVKSAMRGKRGQAFLRELLAALDALPEKRLIAKEFEADGQFCALGSVGRLRGMDMGEIDPDDSEMVAKTFGIADAMAKEIMYWNDDAYVDTPEGRYVYVRTLVEKALAGEPPA